MTTEEGSVSVESTGETVGEAKWQALRELEALAPGLDRSSVRFQVVSEGERGLLGVGYEPARVVATADPVATPAVAEPAPALGRDESDRAALTREVLEHIGRALGVRLRVDVEEDDQSVAATCTGNDLAILIGRHGQTIDAVQYLVNAIAARSESGERKEIVVDAAGYRLRRQAVLDRLAEETAEQVIATGEPAELQPMSSAERKAVHVRLKDHPGVQTASEGAEPTRYVVVLPATGDSGEPEGSPGSPPD